MSQNPSIDDIITHLKLSLNDEARLHVKSFYRGLYLNRWFNILNITTISQDAPSFEKLVLYMINDQSKTLRDFMISTVSASEKIDTMIGKINPDAAEKLIDFLTPFWKEDFFDPSKHPNTHAFLTKRLLQNEMLQSKMSKPPPSFKKMM